MVKRWFLYYVSVFFKKYMQYEVHWNIALLLFTLVAVYPSLTIYSFQQMAKYMYTDFPCYLRMLSSVHKCSVCLHCSGDIQNFERNKL
jgi:hypothetical protein